ncbi:DarB-like antirestriction [Erwinia phage Pavtok]|uniref:Lytic transglycosylase n=1 Tax=Erwinia phage Pavtok TaxID=2267655 RepID=A0A345BLY4_9CAUD|nr:DarB-like antirestriction [Erwinia phage Pavtok]AXF51455.1 lytic transglycosylase [Erwinia phage Pavtok]
MPRNSLQSPLEKVLSEQPSFGLPAGFEEATKATMSTPSSSRRQSADYSAGVPFQGDFETAARKYGVPVNVLMGFAEQESSFNPTALGQPTKYGRAKGLMQYIDSTASAMGINPYDPTQSIDAAARQLRQRLDKGYSMQEAVSAHFGGDDRKQWGPKTQAYGREVLARADKFAGITPGASPTGGQQQAAGLNDYPPAQSAMENMQQTELRSAAIRREKLLSELNADEPDRYRPLSAEEMQQIQQAQSSGQSEVTFNGNPTPISIPTLDGLGGAKPQPAQQGQQPQQEQGFMDWAGDVASDAGQLLKSGINTAAKDVHELVGRIPVIGQPIVNASDRFDRWANGKSTEELFKEWDDSTEKAYTPALAAARKKSWVVEPGDDLGNGEKAKGYSFGPAWSDPRAYMSGMLESLPEMAVTMGGSGRLASMAYKRALAGGATREVAARAAARTATVAGGILEGGLGGAASARQTRDEINKMTPEQLKDSGALQALMADGKTFEQARSALAESSASKAFVLAGVGTGLFGGMGDRALAKVITNGAGGRLKSALTGAIGEGLFEEVPQSALQQMGENYAMQDADPSRTLMKGVANQAAGGLAVGGLMGAGMGAAAPHVQNNDAALEDQGPAGALPSPDAPEPAPAAPTGERTPDVTPTPSGPLGRSLQGAAPETAKESAHPQDVADASAAQWLGAPGSVATFSPAEDPDTRYTVTVEGYRDGEVFARTEDGSPFQFGRDEIVPHSITTPDQASNEGEKTEVAPAEAAPAAPLEAATEAAAATPAPAPQREVRDVKVEERPQERTLAEMSEEELRGRMKYLAQQAKQAGWDKRLTQERRRVEAAINAKTNQREATAGGNVEQPAAEVPAAKPNDNQPAVRGSVESGVSAEAQSADAATGRADGSLGEDAPATPAGAVSDAALTGTDGAPKWFGTAAKAAQHIERKNLDGYRVQQVGPKRFEIHRADAATAEQTPAQGQVQQQETPAADVGQPRSAVKKTNTPFANRARKMVGAEGSIVSPSGDVGYAKGGEQYRIAQIDKNGTVHLENVATGAGTAVSRAEMEAGRSRTVEWSAPKADAQTAAPSVAKPATDGRDWQRFDEDSGSLLVPRNQMPQIKTEHRGALVNFLNARGIEHEEKTVSPDTLKPTQAEYSQAKVREAVERNSDRAILVADGDQIIDGHHQWLAKKEQGEPIRVINLKGDVLAVLDAAKEFPSSTVDTVSASNQPKTDTKPAKAASETAKAAPQGAISQIDRNTLAGLVDTVQNTRRSLADIGAEMDVMAGQAGEASRHLYAVPDTKSRAEFAAELQRRIGEEPAQTQEQKQAKPAAAQETAAKDADRFSDNKLFTADRVAAARARMKSKFGQLNSGMDPELLIDGMTIAGAYIESGMRKFSDYAKAMVDDFGGGVKPYLLSFWEGARNYPGLDTEGMTSVADSAAEHKALLTPEDSQTDAVGEIVQKPAKRSRKTGKAADMSLTDDWGVEHIDGYGESTSGRETGSDLKDAFLKESRQYLNAVADQLENTGFTPTKNAKGKFVGAVNVNPAGDAVSGDITLVMDGPNGRGAYINISGTSLRGAVPTTMSGIGIMYRATTPEDRYGSRSTNQWAPVSLSATDLATLVREHVEKVAQRDTALAEQQTRNAERRQQADQARPTGGLDDMVSQFDSEVVPNEPEQLGGPSQGALEGTPANSVQTATGERAAATGTETGGRADARGNDGAGGSRPEQSGSVGNDAREVPVSTGGSRTDGRRADAERPGDAGRDADPQPAGRGRADQLKPAAGTPAQDRPAPLFTIDPATIGKGGDKTKYRNNVAAIRLLKELEASGRQATAAEQQTLSQYVGWGGIPQAFHRNDGTATKGWEKEARELRDLLTDEEYEAATASTRNAHYTSPEIVAGMWKAVERLGFTGGRVIEPSVGVGNFFGMMPVGVRSASQLHGVELDRITSGIAAQLYPEAKIARMGYQEYAIPDGHFDVAIGNPPFGSEKLYDGKRKDLSGFSIHNYFFARSIDALRPNGVLAMVVTNRFLDSASDKARQYMADRADLLAAVRLPNNAFAKNAGTEVTTDIIFLRKRAEGEAAGGTSWLNTVEYKDKNGATVPLNEYFAANPDMMLGDFGAYGSMYREGDAALVAREGQDTARELERAIARLPENVITAPVEVQPESRETVKAESARVGSMFINADGRVMVRGEDVLGENTAETVTFPSTKAEERVTGMIRVRDALSRLRQYQLSNTAKDATIEQARAALNKVYDKFVAAHGPINLDVNKRLFRDDPTWPQISALEDGFDKGISAAVAKKTGEEARKPSAKKAAIFSKRTQQPYAPVTTAATAKDALVASLAERGRVDMDLMQDLYGKSEEAIADELGNLLFNAPGAGWQTREEYLSGNVKKKLAQAREAAQTDPAYARNVEALEAVQPKDIEAVDINVKPGAAWVPADTMAAFADHITEGTGAKAFYNKLTARWSFPGLTASSSATARYGTSRMNVGAIIEAAAAQKAVQVYDQHQDGTRTLNETETQLANDKANLVRQEWDRWIWGDDARRQSLSRLYNDQFNTDVARDFDGSHLTFPGKVSDDIVKLRPHQSNFVWRVVQGGTSLADHVVGAGKTFSLVASIMELRRLGLARKPVLTVPNHLVGQWAADFLKLYPGANVLAASKADFEKSKRQRLFARIATGDWDVVIVAHSSFGKVQMDPELEADFIREEIRDLTDSISQIEAAEGKRTRNVKQAQDRKTRLEEKLKKLIDSERKDNSLYWSELGIDALAVDEFHEFKNLAFTTGMRNVAGLGNPTGSQKAMDMYMKIRHVLSVTGGRNVITATGTPISNTMAEMYTMQRYMDYDTLKDQGLSHFDAWARMFGEVVTDWELSPSGQYKMNSRFAKFVNMPELMQRYTSFADTVNRDDINRMLAAQGKRLPVPKVAGGKPENVVVPRSPEQAEYIGEPTTDANGMEVYPEGSLVYRAENLPKKPEKGADNMLKIMSDARKAALDMRLIDPAYPDNPNSKVNHAAGRIKAIYDQWHDDRGTQLVFIDLSTPKGAKAAEGARIRDIIARSESDDAAVAEAAQAELDKLSPDELLALDSDFSVYDDLKQKLIDRGIPEAEIAFIHDANTELQKEELFGKVRTGRVRVMFGSTAKMGAGMNVQNRLVALHHLDAPWRPSDLEQREGRIIRQGNDLYDRDPEGFEVRINRYATKQTLDSRMWQTIESKANFIEQVRKGNTGSREIEDIGGEAANAAEMKAASSGNPLILEEMTLRQKVRTLENERVAHDRDQFRIRDRIGMEEGNVRTIERTLRQLREDAKRELPAKFAVEIGGETFDKRADAGEAILAVAANMERDGVQEQEIGNYGGFSLHLERMSAERFILSANGTGSYETKVELGADAQGLATRLANSVRDLDAAIEKMETAKATAEKAIPSLREQVKPWAKGEQLEETTRRHAEVIDQLKPKKQESTVAKPATDAPEQQYNDLSEGSEFAADALAELAAHDEMFAYPRATGLRSLQGVFDTVMPDVKIRWETPKLDDNSNETEVTHIRGVTGRGRDINIYQTADEVWFDVSNVNEGEGGAGIYQAVAEYALNTGRKFVGDPDGLSDIALRRRTEAMLSSALKHGTTDHLEPHERQLNGDKALGVPPLRWKEGDFAFNIRSLIDTSLANIKAAVPEIDRARYDFDSGTYRTGKGEPILAETLRSWSERGKVRAARAGVSTLRRSILLNTLARTESGAQSGLLERLFRVSGQLLSPELHNTFYDWTKDQPYQRLPQGNRIQLNARLRKLEQMNALGQITPEEYSQRISEIADWLEGRTMEHAAKKAFAERVRGSDLVLERLHRARRRGDISEHAADIAIWALNQNPQLAEELGISIREKGGSRYDRVERIAHLMTGNMRDTTPIHEILHHTERMMPPEVQSGIAAEYNKAWERAYKKASPELRQALDALRLSAFGDRAAREATMKAFENGTLDYHQHYQLTNASEYWAVNAAEIMADRFVASQKGWVDRARHWLKEFVQKARGWFGLSSNSAVIKGLNAVIKGDGTFQSGDMLGVHPAADRPAFNDQPEGDYANMPNYGSGMDPRPDIPTDAQDRGKIRSWWDNFKDAVKNAPSDLTTQAMQKGLAVLPMRPLVTELAKNMPAAKDYMRLKQSMDAMRSEWHAKTDKVAQRWLKYRVKHPIENSELMDLMHESTRAQVDPAFKFAPLMTDRERDALRTAASGSDRENELLKKAASDRKRRDAHRSLEQRFKALSPEAQALFNEVRDAYTSLADAYEAVLMQNMEKAINVRITRAEREHRYEMERIRDEALEGEEKADAVQEANRKLRAAKTKIAWNRKARITQLRQQFETERLAGPYFPLSRFGNLFVTVREKETGHVVSFSRFEHARDQRRFTKLMAANPEYDIEIGALDDTAAVRKAVDPNFVADVEDILQDLPGAEKVKDEVWQRYLESLPDMSVRKNRIHRLGRAGYDADALRAFGSGMFHGSHQLARLAHSFDMEEAIEQAREEARYAGDPVRDALVVNEIAKRHEFVMNPTGGPIAQTVTQAAFVWALAGSPKAAIMNLFQTTIMGVPMLAAYDGARLNSFARAGMELNKALVDFTRGRGFAERSKGLTADEKKAMQDGYNIGIIDRTQSHDLAGIGETGVEYKPFRTKVMNILGWGFHHSERLNREVTYLAAYRMARKKGEGHQQAVNTAGDLTWKTHFDYQNTSRPRVMHSDLMKAALVFRNFQVNMLYRLFRDTHQAIHADGKQAKREALTQLAGVTGMMMLNAGITGTWLFGIAMMMAGLFTDDGDDPQVELKKGMVNALGPMMAGIILDGVPGYTTGTSLSGSVGMPDLWFRSPDRELEGKSEFEYWQSQLLGAAPSLLSNVVRGYSMITQGETYRGIETMMPKMFKDPMRAYRFATDGATNLRGDTVTDVTNSDVVKQALGFTPARLAEQYAINSANYNKQQHITTERKRLIDRYWKAGEKNDDAAQDKLLDEIDKFNDKYPEQVISGRSLSGSAKTRTRNADQATGGMRYNNKLRDRLLEEQAPTVYK